MIYAVNGGVEHVRNHLADGREAMNTKSKIGLCPNGHKVTRLFAGRGCTTVLGGSRCLQRHRRWPQSSMERTQRGAATTRPVRPCNGCHAMDERLSTLQEMQCNGNRNAESSRRKGNAQGAARLRFDDGAAERRVLIGWDGVDGIGAESSQPHERAACSQQISPPTWVSPLAWVCGKPDRCAAVPVSTRTAAAQYGAESGHVSRAARRALYATCPL